METKALERFGLSEKEAKVYLACLELGESTASDIAVKKQLPRTLVYDLLERLIALGVVSYVVKAGKKFFRAADPEQFLNILREKEKAVQDALPGMIQLQKFRGIKRPKIEIYEGGEGLKTVLNDMIKSNVKDVYVYGSSRSGLVTIPYFMHQWHRERIKRKVTLNAIYNDTKGAHERIEKYSESMKYINYRFMPIQLESPTATVIYSDKIALIQFLENEPFAVMIESKEMARNHRQYFDQLWKIARPPHKN